MLLRTIAAVGSHLQGDRAQLLVMGVLLWHLKDPGGRAMAVACLQGELTRPPLADHVRLSQCTRCDTAACSSVWWSV